MGWAWKPGTPTERANLVRNHAKIPELRYAELCRLFNLTSEGLWEILKGSDWKPEHDMNAERELRLELIRAESAKRVDG